MNPVVDFVRAVEKLHALLALVALAVTFLWFESPAVRVGVIAGICIGGGNFRLIGFIVGRMRPGGNMSGYVMLFSAKLALLAAVCFLLIVKFNVAVFPFMAGISVVYAAVMVQATRQMAFAESSDDAAPSGLE